MSRIIPPPDRHTHRLPPDTHHHQMGTLAQCETCHRWFHLGMQHAYFGAERAWIPVARWQLILRRRIRTNGVPR